MITEVANIYARLVTIEEEMSSLINDDHPGSAYRTARDQVRSALRNVVDHLAVLHRGYGNDYDAAEVRES
jgi:hypothetical protein